MSKTSERLITFFIGIPVIVGCAAISWCNHILLHFAIIATTTLSAYELSGILSKSMSTQPRWLVVILSDLIPIVTGLQAVFGFSDELVKLTFISVLIIVFALEIWDYNRTTHTFEKASQKMASSIVIIVYSGYFMSFISRISNLPDTSALAGMFLLLIFGCDSCAWLFGITMGKNNRGFIVASPNKSLMGFIGGYVGSFIALEIAFFCFPVLEDISFWKIAIIAISIATTAILGDLVESVMKRASNVKDSGSLIPGRGGLLDSADSIIFSAPVYYLLLKLLLGI